jgi:hypothetical protein
MLVEKFKADLRALCTLIEDLQIQNFVYYDAILEVGGINLPALEDRVKEAHGDPVKRKQVHEMYSQMWEGLETSGNAALAQALLEDLPQTDKPN